VVVKLILGKVFMLLLGNGQRTMRFLILIFLGILMIIRIFWKPIEYFVIFVLILVLYKLISRCISKNIEDKLEDIRNLINLGKFEKALEKVEEVITKDLPYVNEDKKKSIYSKCIYYKANCLSHIIYKSGNIENMKQCVRLYEEALELALKENKPVVELMSRVGTAYYNLGLFQNDGELLKIAVKVLESALEEEEQNREQLITSIHRTLGYCYQELANYFDRDEYLKKSLEELDYVFDETSKENTQYSKAINASIMISRASVLRKLNELNFNENYKIKAIDDLNNAMKHYKNANNKHYKKYFITQYTAFMFQIATACFEMFKISNSEEYMKECKESIKEVKEGCAKENNVYVIKKISEISAELDK
jgi:tetratricopeptide (TPR) repeat protein